MYRGNFRKCIRRFSKRAHAISTITDIPAMNYLWAHRELDKTRAARIYGEQVARSRTVFILL